MSQDWPEDEDGEEEEYIPPPPPRRSASRSSPPDPALPPQRPAPRGAPPPAPRSAARASAPPPQRAARRPPPEREEYTEPQYSPRRGQRPPPRPAPRQVYYTSTVAERRAAARPQPRRDSFPLAVAAVILLLIAGLIVVFIGLNSSGANTNAALGTVPTVAFVTPNAAATPAGSTVPRITLADFKSLYDNVGTRPLILDVRAKDAYDQGHIVGAENFPESDVDARYKELPKDKLIVAYCQ